MVTDAETGQFGRSFFQGMLSLSNSIIKCCWHFILNHAFLLARASQGSLEQSAQIHWAWPGLSRGAEQQGDSPTHLPAALSCQVRARWLSDCEAATLSGCSLSEGWPLGCDLSSGARLTAGSDLGTAHSGFEIKKKKKKSQIWPPPATEAFPQLHQQRAASDHRNCSHAGQSRSALTGIYIYVCASI